MARKIQEVKSSALEHVNEKLAVQRLDQGYFKQTNCATDTWSYAGMDSTAVVDIAVVEDNHLEGKSYLEWERLNKRAGYSSDKKIKKLVKLLRELADNYNLLINQTQKELAVKAIWLGKYLNTLKELVKEKGELWGNWAEQNIPFISKRNREKYMRIAKREDCHKYTFLGVDRLDLLCSATEKMKSPDPIGKLLQEYEIYFNPKSEDNLANFKNKVDAAIFSEKLKSEGFSIPFDLVYNLTLVGVKFDSRLISKLRDISDSNGDPHTYLEKLSMNAGKGSSEPDEDKRLQDFNTLANRLIKTIDYLILDRDDISKVDRDTFQRLWLKMEELGELGKLIAFKKSLKQNMPLS